MDVVSGVRSTPREVRGGLGECRYVLFASKRRVLAGGAVASFSPFVPGFAGRIIALGARVLVAGTGAGASQSVTVRISTTATTGGVLALTLAKAVLGYLNQASDITALNDFGPGSVIDLAITQATAFTAGEVEFLILCEEN